MRSGDLDTLIRIVRPGALQQQGRSRVPGAEAVVADNVPARMVAGIGNERFASAENIATAPSVFVIRRDPAYEVDAGDIVIELEEQAGVMQPVRRYDLKSVRPWPQDQRHALELSGVREAN